MIGFTTTRDGISLTIQGKSFFINNTSKILDKVKEELKNSNEEALLELLDEKLQVITFSDNRLKFKDNTVYFDNNPLPSTLSDKIVSLYREGFPFEPFVKFYERLKKTPSNRVLTQLLNYLEAGSWPILQDGRILAYKVVKLNPYKNMNLSKEKAEVIQNKQHPSKIQYSYLNNPSLQEFHEILNTRDYIDIYSSSVPQGIGDILSVPRNSVDDNPNVTCSHGLHTCSHSYTSQFGNAINGDDVVLLVAVCPSNWVSVPIDHNNAKARVCEYEILSIHENLTEKRVALYQLQSSYKYSYSDENENDEEDEYDNYYNEEE